MTDGRGAGGTGAAGGGGGGTGGAAAPDRVVAGRYRLLGPLGRGGMGVVWRARDEVLAREVAVKEVRAPAGLDGAEVGRLYRRLEREAWAAARVAHRGVVTVYDVVTEDGRPWIVMELVRGLSLADALEAEGPLAPQRAAHVGEQVLAALRAAHAVGVLHRDVKPANVLLANDGRVVLGDFGIARLEGSTAITVTGEVVGSPEYIAPEVALGGEPGTASDLWSLGVTLYTAVEGVSPFRRESALSTLRAVVEGEPREPRRAGALAPVLEGLLHKDPDERPPAEEAARMLRIVGAGGALRDPGGPRAGAGVPEPAVPAHGGGGALAHPGPTAPMPRTGPAPVAEPGAGHGPRPHGPGRAGPVLAAGVAVLVAAVAVLTWLLLAERAAGGGDGSGSAGPSASSASPSASDAEPGAAGGSAGSAGGSGSASASASASVSASASGSPSPSGTAAPHASAAVRAVRAAYAGSCPPAAWRAPAFTAAVAVEPRPASVEYRWVRRGGGSAEGWRSAPYPADGRLELDHTELAHRAGGTLEDAVRLEVRGPAEAVSEWVGFSVVCEEEPPPGGSPSPGTSASPGPGASPEPEPEPDPQAGGGSEPEPGPGTGEAPGAEFDPEAAA